MILIQLILIVAIVAIVVRFISSRDSLQTQAWKKILLSLFSAMAVVLVLFPKILDGLAHQLGVGRGADLLLYGLAVAFVFEQLNGYVRNREEQKRIVILARKIAISETLRKREQRKDA